MKAIPLSGSTSACITLMVMSFCNCIFTAPSYTSFFNSSTICYSKQTKQIGSRYLGKQKHKDLLKSHRNVPSLRSPPPARDDTKFSQITQSCHADTQASKVKQLQLKGQLLFDMRQLKENKKLGRSLAQGRILKPFPLKLSCVPKYSIPREGRVKRNSTYRVL